MSEKLTYDLISRSHEKFSNVKVITVKIEIEEEIKEFELDMYKYFSPVGIKNCSIEFIKNIDRARKEDVDGFGNVQEPYLLWLLIKHFTELGESMPNDFKEQMASLKEMIDTTAFFQIIIHFDENQIDLIREELEIAIATHEVNINYVSEMKKTFEKSLKDKSLLD